MVLGKHGWAAGDELENRYTLAGIKGSNPFPSARIRHEIDGFSVLADVPSSAT